MDYLFFSSLSHVPNATSLPLKGSYDIACQWARNIWRRMASYPERLHLDSSAISATFLVPKFHLPAHIEKCQTSFSFNLTPHVGRTDGEAPERGWADIEGVASSTKEMGPGMRRDTLDDHFGHWNWEKMPISQEQSSFRMYWERLPTAKAITPKPSNCTGRRLPILPKCRLTRGQWKGARSRR